MSRKSCHSARNYEIVAAYIAGGASASFASVGSLYGLSGERVRQIVGQYEAATGLKVPRARAGRVRSTAPPVRASIAQRLLRHASLVVQTCCWEWNGQVDRAGRPSFSAGSERYAHRLAFKLWCGPIPPRFHVVPACGTRACISPLHLVALAPSAALRLTRRWDRVADAPRSVSRTKQTHCRRGHEFTPENTEWNHSTKRDRAGLVVAVRTRLCRICARVRRRRFRQRRAAR